MRIYNVVILNCNIRFSYFGSKMNKVFEGSLSTCMHPSSAPILLELREDLHNESKWLALVNAQTTPETKLAVLLRAVATVNTLQLWEQAVQASLTVNSSYTSAKLVEQALTHFSDNADFWDLLMDLKPGFQTFSAALTYIDKSAVWPRFAQFLMEDTNIELEKRVEGLVGAAAFDNGVVATLVHRGHLDLAQQVLPFVEADWEVWKPVVLQSTDCQFLEIAVNNHPRGAAVVRLAESQPGFKEARAILLHFLELAPTVDVFVAAFSAAVKLYIAQIDDSMRNHGQGGWQTTQLLTEFDNITRKQAMQLSNTVLRECPHNIGAWLDRARALEARPHVAADTIERAIATVDPQQCYNGDITDLYVCYARILLTNGSESAFIPLQTRLIEETEVFARARLTQALAEIQVQMRNNDAAYTGLETALNDEQMTQAYPQLWKTYFKLLKQANYDRLLSAFSRCCVRGAVTMRIVLQVAQYFPSGSSNQRSVFDKGVTAFPTPLNLPVWLQYLQTVGSGATLEDMRALYNRAFHAYLPISAKTLAGYEQFVLLYRHAERSKPRGSWLNIRRSIARILEESQNYAIWETYVASFTDLEGKRQSFERAINTLKEEDASRMALAMAVFEEDHREIQRSRELYQYAATLTNNAETLNKWEQFERRYSVEKVGFVAAK